MERLRDHCFRSAHPHLPQRQALRGLRRQDRPAPRYLRAATALGGGDGGKVQGVAAGVVGVSLIRSTNLFPGRLFMSTQPPPPVNWPPILRLLAGILFVIGASLIFASGLLVWHVGQLNHTIWLQAE